MRRDAMIWQAWKFPRLAWDWIEHGAAIETFRQAIGARLCRFAGA